MVRTRLDKIATFATGSSISSGVAATLAFLIANNTSNVAVFYGGLIATGLAAGGVGISLIGKKLAEISGGKSDTRMNSRSFKRGIALSIGAVAAFGAATAILDNAVNGPPTHAASSPTATAAIGR